MVVLASIPAARPPFTVATLPPPRRPPMFSSRTPSPSRELMVMWGADHIAFPSRPSSDADGSIAAMAHSAAKPMMRMQAAHGAASARYHGPAAIWSQQCHRQPFGSSTFVAIALDGQLIPLHFSCSVIVHILESRKRALHVSASVHTSSSPYPARSVYDDGVRANHS